MVLLVILALVVAPLAAHDQAPGRGMAKNSAKYQFSASKILIFSNT
jgi:hypothetical protein